MYADERITIVKKWGMILENFVVKEARRIVVNSLIFTEQLISEYGIDCNKIVVIHNCFNPELFDPQRVQIPSYLMPYSSKPIVGFIGYLKPEEDLVTLVKAAFYVLNIIPSAIFLIVGDGPLRAFVLKEIERLGMEDNFRILRARPHSEIPGILKALCIFVAPRANTESAYSAMPVKLIEAMAMGTSIVTTDMPVIKETVDYGAILVPSGDYKSFAKAVISLLKDPSARKKIGEKARKRALRFRRERVVSDFARAIRSVIT